MEGAKGKSTQTGNEKRISFGDRADKFHFHYRGNDSGLDPVMNKYFLEEKKGSMLPRVAPDLSPETYWYYINAHHIDQNWSVRACGVRQRHVDQALG